MSYNESCVQHVRVYVRTYILPWTMNEWQSALSLYFLLLAVGGVRLHPWHTYVCTYVHVHLLNSGPPNVIRSMEIRPLQVFVPQGIGHAYVWSRLPAAMEGKLRVAAVGAFLEIIILMETDQPL